MRDLQARGELEPARCSPAVRRREGDEDSPSHLGIAASSRLLQGPLPQALAAAATATVARLSLRQVVPKNPRPKRGTPPTTKVTAKPPPRSMHWFWVLVSSGLE